MPEYLIDGHRVTCTQDDQGRRGWHCHCQDYERRLVRYGEGFCEHVALAIMVALFDSDLEQAAPHPPYI